MLNHRIRLLACAVIAVIALGAAVGTATAS